MALGSTQPLTEMSTREFHGGKCGRCVRLTTLPPSCTVVMKSGNLHFLEPSGPLQACNGTDFPFNIFLNSCHLLDNVEKYGRDGQAADENTIWCMRFARWITKATDTHSENVIVIAVAWQQWLSECTSLLPLYVYFLFC